MPKYFFSPQSWRFFFSSATLIIKKFINISSASMRISLDFFYLGYDINVQCNCDKDQADKSGRG